MKKLILLAALMIFGETSLAMQCGKSGSGLAFDIQLDYRACQLSGLTQGATKQSITKPKFMQRNSQ